MHMTLILLTFLKKRKKAIILRVSIHFKSNSKYHKSTNHQKERKVSQLSTVNLWNKIKRSQKEKQTD